MAIRLNPDLIPNLLYSIQQNRQNQATATEQISTGRRVNVPSDDPASAAAIVGNHAQATEDDQFLRNVSGLQSKFQVADSTLNSAVQVLTRAVTLGVEGANGTLSAANRQAVAGEVQGLMDQMLSLANLSYQGTYVFAGTAVTTQPFVVDSTSPDGVAYKGDTGVNSIELSSGQAVQINVPGSQLFLNPGGNVFGALNQLYSALLAGTGMDTAVSALNTALGQLNSQRVTYGNALNQLQLTESFLSQEKINLSKQESSLVGADLAATATQLAQAQTASQAVLSATGRILGLPTLLDYLK